MSDPKEFRPDRRVSGLAALLFVGTGAVLIWLGFVLAPSDREAMDGFQRLLFTIVPIKPFSWAMGLVFMALGLRVAYRGLRGPPSLVVSDAGLTLGAKGEVPWLAVARVSLPSPDSLLIEILRDTEPERTVLSRFELGRDPEAVVELIRTRVPGAAVDQDD